MFNYMRYDTIKWDHQVDFLYQKHICRITIKAHADSVVKTGTYSLLKAFKTELCREMKLA